MIGRRAAYIKKLKLFSLHCEIQTIAYLMAFKTFVVVNCSNKYIKMFNCLMSGNMCKLISCFVSIDFSALIWMSSAYEMWSLHKYKQISSNTSSTALAWQFSSHNYLRKTWIEKYFVWFRNMWLWFTSKILVNDFLASSMHRVVTSCDKNFSSIISPVDLDKKFEIKLCDAVLTWPIES